MIRIIKEEKKYYVEDDEGKGALSRTSFGTFKDRRLYLTPEEVLYILEIRNGEIRDKNLNLLSPKDVFSEHFRDKKFTARYFVLKDWRDRGLVIKPYKEAKERYKGKNSKKYRTKELKIELPKIKGVFFEDDLITMSDEGIGKEYYEKFWFGQYGTYKAAHRGKFTKFDIYETLFLLENGKLELDLPKQEIEGLAKKRISHFVDIYSVYSDWRKCGYVVKTGFKFGTHFRIYFPGAVPGKKDKEWLHSKHVLHIFPKPKKLLISDWARAIRVAHSVKKTFILAIPGKDNKKEKEPDIDFLGYHRSRGGKIEKPKKGKPKYIIWALSEDEYIGGNGLESVLKKAEECGLELLLGISDRESSVTYYWVRKIDLPRSRYNYYQIEWIQP